MKTDARPFMIWGFDNKNILVAMEEALAYFAKKYKDYPYIVREIRIAPTAEYPTETITEKGKEKIIPITAYKGIPIHRDPCLFSKNNLTITFDEKENQNKNG